VPVGLTVVCIAGLVGVALAGPEPVRPGVTFTQSGHWVIRADGAVVHVNGDTERVDAVVELDGDAVDDDGRMVLQGATDGFVVGRDRVWVFDKSALLAGAQFPLPSTDDSTIGIEVPGGPYLVHPDRGIVRLTRSGPVEIPTDGPLGTPVGAADGTVWVQRTDDSALCALRKDAVGLDCSVGDEGTAVRRAEIVPGSNLLRLVDGSGRPDGSAPDAPLVPGEYGPPQLSGEIAAVVSSAGMLRTFTRGIPADEATLGLATAATAMRRGEDGRIYVDDGDGHHVHVVHSDGKISTVDLRGAEGTEAAVAAPDDQREPVVPPPPGQAPTPSPEADARTAPAPTDPPAPEQQTPVEPPPIVLPAPETPPQPVPDDAAPEGPAPTVADTEGQVSAVEPTPSAAPEAEQPDARKPLDPPATAPGQGNTPLNPAPPIPPESVEPVPTAPDSAESAHPTMSVPDPVSPPTDVSAEAGSDSNITVKWTAPIDAPAGTTYRVRASSGAIVESSTTSATFPGLAPGTKVTFIVEAVNGVATSEPSQPSNAVTAPAGQPGAPVGMNVSRTGTTGEFGQNDEFSVEWEKPELTGGTLLEYEVRVISRQSQADPPITRTKIERHEFTRYHCNTPFTIEVRAITQTPGSTDRIKGPPATRSTEPFDCTMHISIVRVTPGTDTLAVTLSEPSISVPFQTTCRLLVNESVGWAGWCGVAHPRTDPLQISQLVPSTEYTVRLEIDNVHGQKSFSDPVRVTTLAR
jgi:hypothetical protein